MIDCSRNDVAFFIARRIRVQCARTRGRAQARAAPIYRFNALRLNIDSRPARRCATSCAVRPAPDRRSSRSSKVVADYYGMPRVAGDCPPSARSRTIVRAAPDRHEPVSPRNSPSSRCPRSARRFGGRGPHHRAACLPPDRPVCGKEDRRTRAQSYQMLLQHVAQLTVLIPFKRVDKSPSGCLRNNSRPRCRRPRKLSHTYRQGLPDSAARLDPNHNVSPMPCWISQAVFHSEGLPAAISSLKQIYTP
jgi:hypothetical protein